MGKWLPGGSGSLMTVLGGLLAVVCAGPMLKCNQTTSDTSTIYDFTLKDVHGKKNISLNDYRGKVVLIVNVATYSGLTDHYYGMNALNSKYGSQGFVVLGFPCNQFRMQEPGANGTEILHTLKYVRPGRGFVPNFWLFEKIEVNGLNEHELYTYLKTYCPPTTMTFDPDDLFYSPIRDSDVAWNWEVFLIGKDGRVTKRARHSVDPKALETDIEMELGMPDPVIGWLGITWGFVTRFTEIFRPYLWG